MIHEVLPPLLQSVLDHIFIRVLHCNLTSSGARGQETIVGVYLAIICKVPIKIVNQGVRGVASRANLG